MDQNISASQIHSICVCYWYKTVLVCLGGLYQESLVKPWYIFWQEVSQDIRTIDTTSRSVWLIADLDMATRPYYVKWLKLSTAKLFHVFSLGRDSMATAHAWDNWLWSSGSFRLHSSFTPTMVATCIFILQQLKESYQVYNFLSSLTVSWHIILMWPVRRL